VFGRGRFFCSVRQYISQSEVDWVLLKKENEFGLLKLLRIVYYECTLYEEYTVPVFVMCLELEPVINWSVSDYEPV